MKGHPKTLNLNEVRPPNPDNDQVKVGQNLFPNDNIERQFVQSETSTDIFKVLPDGQVVLKKDLDREALCGKSDTCTFSSIVSSIQFACTRLHSCCNEVHNDR